MQFDNFSEMTSEQRAFMSGIFYVVAADRSNRETLSVEDWKKHSPHTLAREMRNRRFAKHSQTGNKLIARYMAMRKLSVAIATAIGLLCVPSGAAAPLKQPPTVIYEKPATCILMENQFERVMGIVDKAGGRFFNKAWLYQTDSGKTFWYHTKIKGVKDTRPYPDRHPYLSPLEAFCKHAEAPIGLGATGALMWSQATKRKLF